MITKYEMSIMTSLLYDVSGWSDNLMRCTVGSPCETVADVFKKRAALIAYVMYRLKLKTRFYTLFRILYSLLTVLSSTCLMCYTTGQVSGVTYEHTLIEKKMGSEIL